MSASQVGYLSWPLPALTMENMEGDYFVVGTELMEGAKSPWKELQAGFN